MVLSMANSLSKLLITILYHIVSLTFALESCGHIGDNRETQGYSAYDGDGFYLDIGNGAYCSGNITSRRVCYYTPPADPVELEDDDLYRVKYAVYRENGTDYIQVSNLIFNFTLGREELSNDDGHRQKCDTSNEDSPIEEPFECYNIPLNTSFAIRAGDIIGACVVGGPDLDNSSHSNVHRLNVVSEFEVNNQSHPTPIGHPLRYSDSYLRSCQMNETLPASIIDFETHFSRVRARRLHISANITIIEGSTETITNGTRQTLCTTLMDILNVSTDSEMDNDNNTMDTFSCSPPSDESSSDSPARRRQRQSYQAIMNSRRLKKICDMIQNASSDLSPFEYVRDSAVRAIRDREVNLSAPMYLLSAIVNRLGRRRVRRQVTELLLTVSNTLLEIPQTDRESRLKSLEPPLGISGSTLLRVLDIFALNNHNLSHPITNFNQNNIGFHVEEVTIDKNVDILSPIDEDSARISIPREVVESTIAEGAPVRMASFLFRNMTGLLPESLGDEDQNDTNQEDRVLRLASPVISASCDNCTTSNLSTPVEVTFTHLSYDKDLLENDVNGTITCVFWKFEEGQNQGSILFAGERSTEGCNTTFTSNSTICHCNHLTHFAILLSAQPLTNGVLSQPQLLALQITGYIGVSASLVAMATAVFIFLFLKPLRTMRNYIHIQLCVTLGIAQIIFVAGIEPRLGEGGGVPIGCRSVAVLLHYWFLVSFMWMLMEGVVLYVALVRVFIKFHGRYMAVFTIASYGLPLLHVGALTLPLGFARSDHYRKYHPYDYGYEQACYLSPYTSFVWSLLAPVILIFLANIGFFIMAIVIMYRHQKRQNIDNKKQKIKHWMKASISLTVVMGITWIIGFLVIEVEELFALAYIFTIFIAFQGVFIFVIFVLFSKQVRENYAKWWKAKVAESDFLSKRFGDRSLTSRIGLSAQSNNSAPLPAKAKGQLSNSVISSNLKVIEISSEEQKLEMESYCDLKSAESCLYSESVKESDTAIHT